nr:M23 family metallopeptidase [Marinitoga sp. 1154]
MVLGIVILNGYIYTQKFIIPVENSYITSSFGEYRDTGNKPHFHTGIDFSSYSRIGYPVKTIDDGYVYKIWLNDKIYGNTIFIYHPDYKILSVYAHLSSFNSLVNSIADSVTKEFGNAFAEVKFPENEVFVSKGDIIAYSGKTGEANVPNVHFEIREVKKIGNKNIEIIKDALEFVNYKETRKINLKALKIRSNGKIFVLDNENNITIPFDSIPKLEVNIYEMLGKNTRIIPKIITLKVNRELVYQITFDSIKLNEMYSPNVVFGYGSTLYNYWIKLYSTTEITPIKINRWNEIKMKDENIAELILEDIWGNIKVYKIILKKR